MNETPLKKYIVSYGNKEIFSCYTKAEALAFMAEHEPTALSDRELFLKVMRGEWEPETGKVQTVYIVDIEDGQIEKWHGMVYKKKEGQSFEVNCYTAPTKELAEKLSEVITGRFKPTDEDAGTVIWLIYTDGVTNHYEWEKGYKTAESIKYFFTSEQLTSFARQQEEKRGKREWMFFANRDGTIDCEFFDEPDQQNRATRELNRIRTELARLSQLLTKE